MNAAIADGGISIQPWQIPRFGSGGQSNGRGVGQATGGTGVGTSQGLGSVGIGGGFGDGPGLVSGDWGSAAQHRGLFGGPGIRTGGAA